MKNLHRELNETLAESSKPNLFDVIGSKVLAYQEVEGVDGPCMLLVLELVDGSGKPIGDLYTMRFPTYLDKSAKVKPRVGQWLVLPRHDHNTDDLPF
jgi:hypothetical protein